MCCFHCGEMKGDTRISLSPWKYFTTLQDKSEMPLGPDWSLVHRPWRAFLYTINLVVVIQLLSMVVKSQAVKMQVRIILSSLCFSSILTFLRWSVSLEWHEGTGLLTERELSCAQLKICYAVSNMLVFLAATLKVRMKSWPSCERGGGVIIMSQHIISSVSLTDWACSLYNRN